MRRADADGPRDSVAAFADLLDDIASLLSQIGSRELSARFADEAGEVRQARTVQEVRAVQRKVRLHLVGTTGSYNDVMSLNKNGALTPELIERYDEQHRQLRRHARRILWRLRP